MTFSVRLEFPGGYVRPLKPVDIHQGYIDGLNDADVSRYLDTVRRSFQTMQSVLDFVKSHLDSGESILWGIWLTNQKFHCGTVRLHGIDRHHGFALIGVCIFKKAAWGKGVGSNAIAAVTQWAFKSLELRWIEAGIYEENAPSQKAFIKAGYEHQFDTCGKYLLDGRPAIVRAYVAHNDSY